MVTNYIKIESTIQEVNNFKEATQRYGVEDQYKSFAETARDVGAEALATYVVSIAVKALLPTTKKDGTQAPFDKVASRRGIVAAWKVLDEAKVSREILPPVLKEKMDAGTKFK